MNALQKSISAYLGWKPYARQGYTILWKDQQEVLKTLDDLPVYNSLGWINQHEDNPSFWAHYRAHNWETISVSNAFSLKVCHETKEFVEIDSSD